MDAYLSLTFREKKKIYTGTLIAVEAELYMFYKICGHF